MRYKAFLLLVFFLLSGCQETADTKDFGFNQSAKSRIDQVFKKSFTLSKNAYKTSLNGNPWAQRLERLAAAGPQTENFSFKGYSESDIALARKVVRDHKNKIKDYRLQNESKPFQSAFPEDSLKKDGKFSIVYVPSTIKVESRETSDGKGKIFVWIGEGNCSQQEGMPPMFRVYEGAEIKNFI